MRFPNPTREYRAFFRGSGIRLIDDHVGGDLDVAQQKIVIEALLSSDGGQPQEGASEYLLTAAEQACTSCRRMRDLPPRATCRSYMHRNDYALRILLRLDRMRWSELVRITNEQQTDAILRLTAHGAAEREYRANLPDGIRFVDKRR